MSFDIMHMRFFIEVVVFRLITRDEIECWLALLIN